VRGLASTIAGALFSALTLPVPAAETTETAHLTVCADPSNLPFSDRAGQGFENRLVELLARDLRVSVTYVWWAQRRGYIRNTLNQAKCDLWPGVATAVEALTTTRPYYRSTYEFLTRADRPLAGLTLDDPRLRGLTLGVQMVGDNASNTPPAHALARRGMIENVRGYMVYADYARQDPTAPIISAVARGKIDVALVWGPLAGYFAARSRVPLRLEPVTPALDAGEWPMTFDISVGVKRGNTMLRDRVQTVLDREVGAIDSLLRSYHVPLARDESRVAASK